MISCFLFAVVHLIPPLWLLLQDAVVPDHLIAPDALPASGLVVSERHYAGDLGATELLLGNGMRVCFKPTTFLDDEVMLTGFAFGGMSEVRLCEPRGLPL